MPIRLFTIPFSEESQSFHDELILQFCTNKRIHKIETNFFTRHGLPYWTVAVHYGQILSEEKVQKNSASYMVFPNISICKSGYSHCRSRQIPRGSPIRSS
ncbi:MAG TPA: hypothetical protein PLL53_17420, partial [Saprospiraceae bacterium]|nr:hypothetical protein [Saprospiraceae bacterium]